jgi:hypothetical protein
MCLDVATAVTSGEISRGLMMARFTAAVISPRAANPSPEVERSHFGIVREHQNGIQIP